jgi:ATP-dependent DNA helicase RecQ
MDAAAAALKRVFGYETFRPGQREVVEAVLARRDALALMPTGGGKSLTYQLPAVMADGLTVVISPLIALMQDQVERLDAAGVAATALTSALATEERERREAAALRGAYRLLYVAPERLTSPQFLALLGALSERVGLALLAVDEAHCVSEWGHDFRPEYRQIHRVRAHYPDVPILALTATATERVRRDIVEQLRLRDPLCHVASFDRPNLYYEVRRRTPGAYRELLGMIRALHQEQQGAPAIVYCQSRSGVDGLAARLVTDGVQALPYHAGLDAETRARNQEAFVRDRVPVLVATVAFGMGIAKPDVRLVAHMDAPRNLESYYQESGRAGRDGDPARCMLFFSLADRAKAEYFIGQMSEPEQQRIARQQLGQVVSYAFDRGCRRRQLLAYFGEEYTEASCGNCDNCLGGGGELVDRTVDAQKLLSAVARTGQRYGMRYVVDVLRGSASEKILERGHQELSVYGIGRDQPAEAWRELGSLLLVEGLLAENTDGPSGYPTVRLTPSSWEVLRGQRQVRLPAVQASGGGGMRGERGRQVADELDEAGWALFERLRTLRRELAEEREVPAFVVFPDSALRDMARRRPGTADQFGHIAGVGRRKQEEFAEAFTFAIQAFCRERGIETWPTQPGPGMAADESAARPERRRQVHDGSTAYTSYELFRAGKSLEEVAAARGLALSTVLGHLMALMEVGVPVAIERLVPDEHRRRIVEALRTADPSEGMKAVKEQLGEDVSYEEIRVVRAWLRTGGG